VAIIPFILASASPRRKALLEQVGIVPEAIVPANTDETPHPHELPKDYAQRVALEKARLIAGSHPHMAILAADTVVACGRRILPKAEDEETARRCLTLLSGRRHRVLTAVCLLEPNDKISARLVETMVKFRRLTASDIDWYIRTNEWQGKAGGYAIQGAAQAFIPAINGSYSSVVGLPLQQVMALLTR